MTDGTTAHARLLPALVPLASRATTLVRRTPFTSAVVLVMIVAGLATGAFWRAAADQPWYPWIAYGVPSLESGRWWTLLTGPFLAVVPPFYLAMTGSFAVFVGWAEWRLGTGLAALTAVAGQLVGILAALVFLLLVRGTGWPWAEATSRLLDVGFSAGALAALAVTSATLRPPWRLRLRLALTLYVLASAAYLGTLADLEHLVAVLIALAVGPRLVRGRAVPAGRPSRREWRLLAVFLLLLMAAGSVLGFLVPNDGPLGPTGDPEASWLDLVITLVGVALLVNGLRKGYRVAWRWAVGLAGANVAVGLLAAVVFVLAALFEDATAVLDQPGMFVADRLAWAALLVLLLVGRRAWRVPSRRARRAVGGITDRETAVRLLERHGGGTVSWMATWPDNEWFVTADGEACVAFQRHAGVAIGLGDPIGPEPLPALEEFAVRNETAGLVPCLFSASDATARAARGAGWLTAQVAEDTLVDLPGLEFRGKAWQDVRSALNKAAKQGITHRLVRLGEERRAVVDQVRELSEQWVGEKGLPEMGFTLGGVDEALDPHVRVGLAVDADGLVHGVTSWLPVHAPGGTVVGWTLDVMRRREGGFRPVVEFLIASACLAFREEGARVVSLSGAPLARTDVAGDTAVLDRLLDTLGARLEPLYGFRSLHAFKAKFQPRYEPMHLVFRDEADLPRLGVALTRAYLPDTSARELVRLARG
ncbi:bifunctional lysylphosphatidylglycerol flippase/synthetase MprF [Pseudonocardia sp. RS010]|uniref:bifunctional lysylphosphatidylglycerol flippase/synthetase MprF n=1 Tax=Pseudonocardia sp. RS010 TaxID=3385979 RepID=UPI0039A0DF6E